MAKKTIKTATEQPVVSTPVSKPASVYATRKILSLDEIRAIQQRNRASLYIVADLSKCIRR